MHDLAIIVVSTNEARWLPPCLTSVLSHAGDCSLDVVVVDNDSTDETAEVVASFGHQARLVRCRNRGFAHANNRALMTTDARYILFLNPDTEVLEGTFSTVVETLDGRPAIGLAGVRQVMPSGDLYPTMRRFPNALRALGQALLPEAVSGRPGWLGERVLNPVVYDQDVPCDWTSGSFMLIRREALESAGFMDERFFIYSEEPDLCLRIQRAGWEVWHVPAMTILHHAGKGGMSPRMAAQDAYARMQYARKHFSSPHRLAYALALGLGYALRLAVLGGANGHRQANKQALLTMLGVEPPPFGEPPRQAVASRDV